MYLLNTIYRGRPSIHIRKFCSITTESTGEIRLYPTKTGVCLSPEQLVNIIHHGPQALSEYNTGCELSTPTPCQSITENRGDELTVSSTRGPVSHACGVCYRCFTSPGRLQQHLQTGVHRTHPAYVCDVCGKTFTHKRSGKVHRRSHAEPRLPDSCAIGLCDGGFPSTECPPQQPGGPMESGASDSNTCVTCDRTFTSLRRLQQHRRMVHFL